MRPLSIAFAAILAASAPTAGKVAPFAPSVDTLAANETCIFILATPGSGSSTMVELFNQHTDCELSGENYGALIELARYDEALAKTDEWPRVNAHADAAWHRAYDSLDTIRAAERALVRCAMPPSSASNESRGSFRAEERRCACVSVS